MKMKTTNARRRFYIVGAHLAEMVKTREVFQYKVFLGPVLRDVGQARAARSGARKAFEIGEPFQNMRDAYSKAAWQGEVRITKPKKSKYFSI